MYAQAPLNLQIQAYMFMIWITTPIYTVYTLHLGSICSVEEDYPEKGNLKKQKTQIRRLNK